MPSFKVAVAAAALLVVCVGEDGAVVPGHASYWYPRSGFGYGWPTHGAAGELPLSHLCKAIVDIFALSGLQYTCMAERKTTQAGYRASCLTCQKVIPELHNVDVQVARWRVYVTTACQNIGTLALDAAQTARTQAHNEYTQALTTLQQRRTQVDTAQRNVDQRLQNEHVIPGATESKPLTDLRKRLTTATTHLNTATSTARTREDAYRVAQLRVELLGNVAGAVATCQSWTSAVQFALY